MPKESLVLWHNPECSKSRAAFELLQGRGIEFTVREYLQQPPDAEELRNLISCEGIAANALLRMDAACALDDTAASDISMNELIETLLKQPHRLQRPILVRGKRAAIGRPAERVLELL